jgi:poly(3-hydroxyalkanoate) synthetase
MSIFPPPNQLFPGFTKIKPRVPVLFVNTMDDHVTPPSGTRQMAKLFEGSRLVIMNGPGHAYSSAPSRCTNAIMKEYMSTGTVPSEETWCEPDVEAEYYFGGETEDWTSE